MGSLPDHVVVKIVHVSSPKADDFEFYELLSRTNNALGPFKALAKPQSIILWFLQIC